MGYIDEVHLKKALSLLLVLCLILGLGVYVYADSSSIVVKTSSTSINKGDSFTVTAEISDNPGFCSLQFVLQFDSGQMECVSMSLGQILKGSLCVTNPSAPDGARIAMAATDPVDGNGLLAKYTFRAKEDIKSTAFTIGDLVISDTNGKDITCSVAGAEIASAPDTPVSSEQQSEIRGLPIVRGVAPDFKDTKNHWGQSFIAQAYKKGIVNGYSATEFGPDDEVTRAEFVTTLYRISGSPAVNASSPFKDIANQSQEFRNAITWAKSKGYVSGISSTEFAPDLAITREEMVTMLFNFSGKKLGGEMMFAGIYKSVYNDYDKLSGWAQSAANWAIYNEYISGTSSSTLSPSETASRAEMAKILLNYTDKNY